MPVMISATFPLGFYQGRDGAGFPESYPTPARLFSALLAGAYSLERNEDQSDQGGLSNSDAEIFGWLEGNPPFAVKLPATKLSKNKAIVYRNHGLAEKQTDRGKQADQASIASFLEGPVCWYWREVPERLIARLGAIAAEVPYLGEAVSPVLLDVVEDQEIPDDALTQTEPSFHALSLDVPLVGRVTELDDFFYKSHSGKVSDKLKGKEDEIQSAIPARCIGQAYYANASVPDTCDDAPWRIGLLVRVEGSKRIPVEDYCMWATCLHRALVRMLGDRIPKCMRHAERDMSPLANCLAIQIVSPDLPIRDEYRSMDGDTFVVMVPAGATPGEEGLIADALSRIETLYSGKKGEIKVSFEGEIASLYNFWVPVPVGNKRIFETVPLFVPEGRTPQARKSDGGKWTLEDDVLVAVGHVWRDRFAVTEKGDRGRVELSESVARAGVSASNCRVVPTNAPRNYVHKINQGAPLVCARALVDLGSLNSDESLIAIGQSRHFGGGLLVPVDIPLAFASGESAELG